VYVISRLHAFIYVFRNKENEGNNKENKGNNKENNGNKYIMFLLVYSA
jgi:hypothetical protein